MKKLNHTVLFLILATQVLSAQSTESLKIRKQTQQNAKVIIT